MADLILMPKARPLMNHMHQMDTSGFHNNCMSPQMPTQMSEHMDFSSDFGEIVALWGDEIYGMTQHSPKYAFWSLDELRAWVREHGHSDVYATMMSGSSGLHLCSTDQPTIESLRTRFTERKNHVVKVTLDALMCGTVREWITDNVAGKHEVIIGSTNLGGRANEYLFRDETDATMFVVRWKGHEAVDVTA
jgi:hypothetical protein